MRLLHSSSRGRRPPAIHRRARAFTLTEVMVSMALFLLVIAGVLVSHITGLKMYETSKAKLGVSDEARRALSKLVGEVRSCKIVRVGTGSVSSFVECTNGAVQEGNAIQIYPGTNTNSFIRYYRDSTDKQLKRMTNGMTKAVMIAEFLTNAVVFASENYAGQVLTDSQNNRVISLTMQFYQIQYPVTPIGNGAYYDFYQLRTKMTRRTLE